MPPKGPPDPPQFAGYQRCCRLTHSNAEVVRPDHNRKHPPNPRCRNPRVNSPRGAPRTLAIAALGVYRVAKGRGPRWPPVSTFIRNRCAVDQAQAASDAGVSAQIFVDGAKVTVSYIAAWEGLWSTGIWQFDLASAAGPAQSLIGVTRFAIWPELHRLS